MDKDERFKHIATDPKFRRIPKAERKVKIDKRFQGMFKDEKFKVKYTVDKRGRPVNHNSTEDLKRYYELSSSDSEDSDSDELKDANESGKFVRAPKSDSEDDLKKTKKEDKSLSDAIKKKLKNLNVDYARGEGCINSESSSDDETESEEDSDDSELDHNWGELDKGAETTEEATKRLAVCNMDWDRIRALDLMVLLNSFLPPGGLIESVTIYPSEFGKQRMREEEINGPTELVKSKKNNFEENEEENEEGSKYHMEKLRKYQLNRLKYYYAVVIFNNPESANKIYSECDGLEYESSATKLDLRFIPDDTTFDETPKEKCEKLPETNKYQPRFFTTTALQQAKVELTWDETNPARLEITQKLSDGKIDDVTDADLQAYLASSSGGESESETEKLESENEDSNENPIEKYRALLSELEKSEDSKKNKDIEMEVTWDLNVKDKTEKLVKKKLEDNTEKTPFQQYLDKRKEKRREKRVEKKNKFNKDENTENSDSDMDVDMNDPYFAEEFNTSEFKSKSKKKQKEFKEEINSVDKQEKAQLELLMLDDDDEKKHFNFKNLEQDTQNKKKKKKNKNQNDEPMQEDDFKVDVKDARFSAIFTSHHYNIDPTDPHYKKTKGMEALIEEKQKRIITNDKNEEPISKRPKSELNALVNSVKRKTQILLKKK